MFASKLSPTDKPKALAKKALAIVATTALTGSIAVGVFPAHAAADTRQVDADGGLRTRQSPSTTSKVTGGLKDNSYVDIKCVSTGSTVTGPYGTTDQWGQLTSSKHKWVSMGFLKPIGKTIDTCDQQATSSSGARVDVAQVHTKAGLNVREVPSTNGAILRKLKDGTSLAPRCVENVDGLWWVELYGGGYVAREYTQGVGNPPECEQKGPDRLGGRERAETGPCTLGGSEEEVYQLMFGAACVDNKEVFGPDPGPQPALGDSDLPNVLQESRLPFYIDGVGPNGEGSYGIRWDGCSVPEQAVLIPGMGDVSHPFGFDFIKACHVHDFGYRLIDRHILPESAVEPLDSFFAQMLGRICRVKYPDRLVGCRQVAVAYGTAVMAADHKPKPDNYPRVYNGPR